MTKETIEDLFRSRPKYKDSLGNPIIDQAVSDHVDFYNRVVFYIRCLGVDTEVNGHSKELDELKNRAYTLIGL